MELLQIKNLSFEYPNAKEKALNNISLSVDRGSFVVLCGKSGCGKTTLLKMIKKEICPFGEKSGEIFYDGKDIDSLDDRISASEIGFVGQNPDEQIVTDKVWHELAFPLENLGLNSNAIRLRVGEMASYFGIQNWYHSKTDELSGGQKQLLNLASVMATQPEILILDEPTAQLDPIAATDFISTLKKLNRDLGITIIIAEHRLEEIFPIADKIAVMDFGEILAFGNPIEICNKSKYLPISKALPTSVRMWNGLDVDCPCPITVCEGIEFLNKYFSHLKGRELKFEKSEKIPKDDVVLEAKNLWFRYEKGLPDILTGLSLTLNKGDIFSILGGNGVGKSTALNVISGLEKAYKGQVKIFGKKISKYEKGSLYHGVLSFLPQNPKNVFIKNSVREDFYEILKAMDIPQKEYEKLIDEQAKNFEIYNLLDKHPYDLSGGEQQRCAIAKLMLTNPKILFLDEPTKGMDAYSKEKLGELLKQLKDMGKTILIVTHDVEFSAEVSNRCGLLFDGEIIAQGNPHEFYSGNNFYTTQACRIAKGMFKNSVICQEIIKLCREN